MSGIGAFDMNHPTHIPADLAQLVDQLRARSESDRRYVIEALEQSLPNELANYLSPEQIAEIDRRLDRHLNDPEAGLTLEEALAELRRPS